MISKDIINKALEQIVEDAEDPDVVKNQVEVIRCEIRGMGSTPTEAIATMVFEPGKKYLVMIDAGSVDEKALANMDLGGADVWFVFTAPARRPVSELFVQMEVKPGTVVFYGDGAIDPAVKIDGVRFVRGLPSGAYPDLAVAERERIIEIIRDRDGLGILDAEDLIHRIRLED